MKVQITALVEKISELYRKELDEIQQKKYGELFLIEKELREVDSSDGTNITLARYNRLIKHRDELRHEIELKEQFAEGIAYAREILLDEM